MMRHNCLDPRPCTSPLIHETTGEDFKIIKTVYLALPWLWSKLGLLRGSLVNMTSVTATLTTTEPVQIIPYPQNVTMKNIKSSVLWALTKDNRRYKYRNCHLIDTGLKINIDLQAPDPQKGIDVVWNIMLTDLIDSHQCGCEHHHHHHHIMPNFVRVPWDCCNDVPPFHFPKHLPPPHKPCDCDDVPPFPFPPFPPCGNP